MILDYSFRARYMKRRWKKFITQICVLVLLLLASVGIATIIVATMLPGFMSCR